MAINYDEAIADLRAEEKRLQEELAQIQASIPGLIVLRNRAKMTVLSPDSRSQANVYNGGRFSRMGATKAIPEVLKDSSIPLATSKILDLLRAEGWKTNSQNPTGLLSATLGQLVERGVVEKVGNGWRLKTAPAPSWPSDQQISPQ